MKYIKKITEGVVSPKLLERFRHDFDSFVDILYDIIDEHENVIIKFGNLDEYISHLSYEDYIEKNNEYHVFIDKIISNSNRSVGINFALYVHIMDKNYNKFTKTLSYLNPNRTDSVWKFIEMNCIGHDNERYSLGYFKIKIVYNWIH